MRTHRPNSLILFLVVIPLVGVATLFSAGVLFACAPGVQAVTSGLVVVAKVTATMVAYAVSVWHEMLSNLL